MQKKTVAIACKRFCCESNIFRFWMHIILRTVFAIEFLPFSFRTSSVYAISVSVRYALTTIKTTRTERIIVMTRIFQSHGMRSNFAFSISISNTVSLSATVKMLSSQIYDSQKIKREKQTPRWISLDLWSSVREEIQIINVHLGHRIIMDSFVILHPVLDAPLLHYKDTLFYYISIVVDSTMKLWFVIIDVIIRLETIRCDVRQNNCAERERAATCRLLRSRQSQSISSKSYWCKCRSSS